MYECDANNYILCGYKKLDLDDDDAPEYSAVIMVYHDSQLYDVIQESELRRTSITNGDFNVLPINYKTLNNEK